MLPGDRLYFYSDALVEAADPEGEEFGKERILRSAESASGNSLEDSLQIILDQITEWQGSNEFDDDLSILALEMPSS